MRKQVRLYTRQPEKERENLREFAGQRTMDTQLEAETNRQRDRIVTVGETDIETETQTETEKEMKICVRKWMGNHVPENKGQTSRG